MRYAFYVIKFRRSGEQLAELRWNDGRRAKPATMRGYKWSRRAQRWSSRPVTVERSAVIREATRRDLRRFQCESNPLGLPIRDEEL